MHLHFKEQLPSRLRDGICWARSHASVVPASWEAEVGECLELRRSAPALGSTAGLSRRTQDGAYGLEAPCSLLHSSPDFCSTLPWLCVPVVSLWSCIDRVIPYLFFYVLPPLGVERWLLAACRCSGYLSSLLYIHAERYQVCTDVTALWTFLYVPWHMRTCFSVER